MVNNKTIQRINSLWDDYVKSNKEVLNTKGNIIPDIDESRIRAIEDIKKIISRFQSNELSVYEFKSTLDSYNKRNNLWGFTATKGQMFFNQLTKYNEQSLEELTALIQNSISEPKSLNEALDKIETLEKFTASLFDKAQDKRKAPNPGSVGYFLSFFWQIHNPVKWPIIYTSLTNAFKELDIWKDHGSQKQDYEYFYNLNEEVKGILKTHAKKEISNWDAEHCFWNFTGKPVVDYKKAKKEVDKYIVELKTSIDSPKLTANFEIADYLIPKVSRLIELGSDNAKSASAKGSDYEKMVGEVFKLLGFEVDIFGQGTGRNPDAIAKFREEHTAFIIDAKAYNDGYAMGRDDRAIREYIANCCPQLRKEGFTKIGFIIVSNSFKTDLKDFANDITWNTEVKRFALLTSEALLYYLAYKTKDDKITLPTIIENIIALSINGVITSQNVIEEFDDI
jgi:hypothetical protein